jgi:enoyl-CoA hydratase
LLDGLHRDPGKGELQHEMSLIRDHFSGETLSDIVRGLSTAKGAAKSWADACLQGLNKRSPMSLVITDRHIRSCRALDLRETLIQDYRLAWRCLEAPDFAEGVRAALIDKDNNPRWSPATLDAAAAAGADRYFAPLGADDLPLLRRDEMQAARV